MEIKLHENLYFAEEIVNYKCHYGWFQFPECVDKQVYCGECRLDQSHCTAKLQLREL